MKILKLAIVFFTTVWVSSANAALIFDFKFTDGNGVTILSGEILGLLDNANGSATDIVLHTTPDYWAAPLMLSEFYKLLKNEFTVSDGVVIFVNYTASHERYDEMEDTIGGTDFELSCGDTVDCSASIIWNDMIEEIYLVSSFELSITQRNNVPEPSTIILMSLGIAGLSFSRYRRQS
jgi:hypothetical protein